MRKHHVEGPVRVALVLAFVHGGPAILSENDAAALPKLAFERSQRLARQSALAGLVADGALDAEAARPGLAGLNAEIRDLDQAIELARTQQGAAASFYALAAEIVEEAGKPGAPYDEVASAILDRFDALDLDARRDIVRTLLYIQIDKPQQKGGIRDASRLHIEQRIVSGLNPWADEDSTVA
jgi:hypothetical protein